jgi:hypothetical protein
MVYHVLGNPQSIDDIKRNKIQPILFLSKLLSVAERNYWPTELEVACLCWAVRRVRHLLEAAETPTIVVTDHAATTGIARATSLTSSSVDKLNMRLVRASQYLS